MACSPKYLVNIWMMDFHSSFFQMLGFSGYTQSLWISCAPFLLNIVPSFPLHRGWMKKSDLTHNFSADSCFTLKLAWFSNEIFSKRGNFEDFPPLDILVGSRLSKHIRHFLLLKAPVLRVCLICWRSVSNCLEIFLMFLETWMCSSMFNTNMTQLFFSFIITE